MLLKVHSNQNGRVYAACLNIPACNGFLIYKKTNDNQMHYLGPWRFPKKIVFAINRIIRLQSFRN